MNHQLALSIQLNHQATLNDFCWEDNAFLKQQINQILSGQGERFIYLWGDEGAGKSHLLQGLCHDITLNQATISYLPFSLLKEWGPASIDGLENQTLIVMDDLDIIGGDKAWEEAIFHLYNRIRENEKTTLITATKQAPMNSTFQLPDLRSRLSSGLIIQLKELNDDAKITTLQQQAEKRGFSLTQQTSTFLIHHCSRNMHILNQLLNTLDEASLKAKRKITIPFIKDVLSI